MKKNQLYRKFFKLRKHAEKGQYILKSVKGVVPRNYCAVFLSFGF